MCFYGFVCFCMFVLYVFVFAGVSYDVLWFSMHVFVCFCMFFVCVFDCFSYDVIWFSLLFELLAPNRDARRPPGSSCFVFIEVCHVIREEISLYHVIPFLGGVKKGITNWYHDTNMIPVPTRIFGVDT